jgi:hypothetical protein
MTTTHLISQSVSAIQWQSLLAEAIPELQEQIMWQLFQGWLQDLELA